MKKICILVSLALGVFAQAKESSEPQYHLMDLNFAAPSVYGDPSASESRVGSIIYDINSNTFRGLFANGTWNNVGQGATATVLPAGAVTSYAGATAPTGYLMCDGSAVSRTTYSALFAVIGTTYGSGDGSTTFNLPNLQGVFVRGAGSQTIGGISYSATLGASQGDQMQGHIHGYSINSGVSVQSGGNASNSGGSVSNSTTGPVSDGTNGTPRAGAETRPANVSMNYIIKI